MASSGVKKGVRRSSNIPGSKENNSKRPVIFQYWGKVYKYQEKQNGKVRKEFVAVTGDLPCVGHGSSKGAAISEVRKKVETMVREYCQQLQCPPMPSLPQKMDELLKETEESVQEDGSEILEQELFSVNIEL